MIARERNRRIQQAQADWTLELSAHFLEVGEIRHLFATDETIERDIEIERDRERERERGEWKMKRTVGARIYILS